MAITIKNEHEIALMRESGRLLALVHEEMRKELKEGMTTKDIDRICETMIRDFGCIPNFLNYQGFPASVCVSINDEVVHGIPSKKRYIENGDIVSLDAGVIYKGYHSDMTRTIVVGKATQAQKDFYALVLEGQKLGVSIIKEGLDCQKADDVVRSYFADHQMAQYFTHALGHGTGLEIHEQPVLSPRSQGVLKKNMIVTVEPGLYIEGKYGVRIEDSVAVTATGCEILTKTSKELMELL